MRSGGEATLKALLTTNYFTQEEVELHKEQQKIPRMELLQKMPACLQVKAALCMGKCKNVSFVNIAHAFF